MKKNWLSAGLMAALLAVTAATPTEAAVFNFTFDLSPNATVTAPFVGSGTFSFDGVATAGTYALTSLSNYGFDFTVNGNNFTNADLATPASNIAVAITLMGSDLLVNFGGSAGGPFGGSADFVGAGGAILSFQPNFGSLYFSGSSFGTYQGIQTTSIPEPMSASLMVLGLAGIMAARRRRA